MPHNKFRSAGVDMGSSSVRKASGGHIILRLLPRRKVSEPRQAWCPVADSGQRRADSHKVANPLAAGLSEITVTITRGWPVPVLAGRPTRPRGGGPWWTSRSNGCLTLRAEEVMIGNEGLLRLPMTGAGARGDNSSGV